MKTLQVNRFKNGDRVSHIDEGPGVVLKDVSNEYAEVYLVKYDKGYTINASEALLTHAKPKEVKAASQVIFKMADIVRIKGMNGLFEVVQHFTDKPYDYAVTNNECDTEIHVNNKDIIFVCSVKSRKDI